MDNAIYLALDFPTWGVTERFLENNQLHGVPVKVGMELFFREGPSIIEKLKANNHPIFLDLKLHDIPTTVKRAMKNLAALEVDIVNVHALGGGEMIKHAKEGLLSGSSTHKTKLIAVTILTSHDKEIMNNQLLIPGGLKDNAVHLAYTAKQSGADGVVCSVHEASLIKEKCGYDFLTVTPGIRLAETGFDDQKRVATPKFARENDADILVIGRSITKSDNPYQAYWKALEEWGHGVK
ncbi:orotidine-5'-phosphate decarboxylase [Oceanobacillus arenosus]|uniref:Orotidine 5'-phosphate decarboxylase n=1 Tax=Oceanobacillus arenosus TaxID=1229153 RepID=A0A3D8PTE8_9BACI|nr:orotidine-5'-phosphate decarboxylase [Oceanobacillus arenosus]RDW18528.1 orotidine-5'-phosphate decarboxylase [Oceanobacillus arenosus]